MLVWQHPSQTSFLKNHSSQNPGLVAYPRLFGNSWATNEADTGEPDQVSWVDQVLAIGLVVSLAPLGTIRHRSCSLLMRGLESCGSLWSPTSDTAESEHKVKLLTVLAIDRGSVRSWRE